MNWKHPITTSEAAEKLLDDDPGISVLNVDGARYVARLVTIENEGTTATFEIMARIAD